MLYQRPLKWSGIGRIQCERLIGEIGLDIVESEFREIARDEISDGVVAVTLGLSAAFDDQLEANGLQNLIDRLGCRDEFGKVLVAEHEVLREVIRLNDEEETARPCDSHHLGNDRFGVLHVNQDRLTGHQVERVVLERQMLPRVLL